MNSRTLLAFLLVAAPSSPGQEKHAPSEPVIARAGDIFITEKEFTQRYEMLPGFGRHRRSQVEAQKLELLYSIVAEKLLAQDAIAKGLNRDTVVQRGTLEVQKLLSRDELYKKEIIGKAHVSREEISRGISQAQLLLTVRYIYFGRQVDAQFVRSQMRRYEDFGRLQIDSSFHALKDTATVIWGTGEPQIEEAAFQLKRKEISPVVEAAGGYFIFIVTGVRRNFENASLAPDVLREHVVLALRRRKEHALLEAFAADVLRDKTGYAVPGALHTLASAFTSVYRQDEADSVIYLTPARASAVENLCAHSLSDTLAVAGNRAWSVEEVIGRLTGQGFGVHRTALGSIPIRLNSELMGLVQRELMGQEALRRGLDTVPGVRAQVEMWRQSFLAGAERNAIQRSVRVTEAEVWSLLKGQDPTVPVPQVQIRELQTNTYDQMQMALEDLSHGMSMEEAVRKWSSDPQLRERGGLSSYFPVTERPPLGSYASRLKLGERYGPVSIQGGVVYFELVGKKSAALEGDTSLARRFAQASADLITGKGRRAVTLRLAELGKERGVDIYSDRLKMIQVTAIPMLAFRILGFGGRMLAMPFVNPELDWLEVDLSKETTVP